MTMPRRAVPVRREGGYFSVTFCETLKLASPSCSTVVLYQPMRGLVEIEEPSASRHFPLWDTTWARTRGVE